MIRHRVIRRVELGGLVRLRHPLEVPMEELGEVGRLARWPDEVCELGKGSTLGQVLRFQSLGPVRRG